MGNRHRCASAALTALIVLALGAMPASAAAQQPTAEGRIGVSLVIPPRITLETSPDDAAAFCSRISGGAELLAIVDRSGHLVPACGTMGATTAKTRNGLRAVLVGPI